MQISAQDGEEDMVEEEEKGKRGKGREETTVEEPMSDIIFLVVAFPLTTKNAYANQRRREREGSCDWGRKAHISTSK